MGGKAQLPPGKRVGLTADPPRAVSRLRVGPERPDRDPRSSKGRLRGRVRHASGIHDLYVCICLHFFIPQTFHKHTWAQGPGCKSLAVLPACLTHTYSRPQLKSDAPAAASHGARASLPRSCEPPALPGRESLGKRTPVSMHAAPCRHTASPRQGLAAWQRDTHPPCLRRLWRSGCLFRLQKEKPLSLPSPVFWTLFSMKVLLRGAQTGPPPALAGIELKIPTKRLRVGN